MWMDKEIEKNVWEKGNITERSGERR